jgi:hypothetical protein
MSDLPVESTSSSAFRGNRRGLLHAVTVFVQGMCFSTELPPAEIQPSRAAELWKESFRHDSLAVITP